IKRIRSLIPPNPPALSASSVPPGKNPPTLFILSPPRSGSTLLRVMLAGHPRLFAPPELGLLAYNTLDQIDDRDPIHDSLTRCIMQLENLDVENARHMLQGFRDDRMTAKMFYRWLQDRSGRRLLVDKTPGYTLHLDTLKRAETDFENPLYIHLLRHPYGMIRSFDEAKMDLLIDRDRLRDLSLTRLQYAELNWLISHQNVFEFFRDIPEERRCRIRFEDLVTRPRQVIEELCQFIGIDFMAGMLEPYKEKKQRMTDGIHKESLMTGDVKFHTYTAIDPSVAVAWKGHYPVDFLGDATWEIAGSFGYAPIKENIKKSAYAPPEPAEEKEYYPLTSAQKRSYIIHRLDETNISNNITNVLTLEGHLDKNRVRDVFRYLVRRHDSLRTSIRIIGGEPLQRMHGKYNDNNNGNNHSQLEMEYHDLTFAGENIPPSQIQSPDDIIDDFIRPFDLARAPLMRVGLIKVPGNNHILMVDIHHIISDGQSMSILRKEFVDRYAGKELPPLAFQYKDFSRRQNDFFNSGEFKNAETFWLNQYKGQLPLLKMPTDYPRPSVRSFRGAVIPFQLGPEFTLQLKEFTRASQTTLYIVLLTVLNILLSRYTSQQDIVIGTPVLNRSRQEFENIVGLLIELMALRNRPAGDKTLMEFLREVKETTLAAYQNQEYPLQELLKKTGAGKDRSRNPLFDVMLVLQNHERPKLEIEGLTLAPYGDASPVSRVDITFEVFEAPEEILINLEYCTRLFKRETMDRFAFHFRSVLERLVTSPHAKISALDIVSPQEIRAIGKDGEKELRLLETGELLHRLTGGKQHPAAGEEQNRLKEMLNRHYRMQEGLFIARRETHAWGVSVVSHATDDPRWNHTALFPQPGGLNFNPDQEEIQSFADAHHRYPTVYIVAESPHAGELAAGLIRADYEAVQTETWFTLENPVPARQPDPGPLTLKEVRTPVELEHFVQVFNDAYSARQVYMGDALRRGFYARDSRDPEVHVRHFTGYI
ncbi:MAG: hypothetical protein GY940_23880, partial [bacterium]|nr:hypothetical protein [bacterium]